MPGLQPRGFASISRQTLIIIIVCVGVGGLVVLVILFRAIRSYCARRDATPLPPIQPLAHQRGHQLAQFEAAFKPGRYDSSFLAIPRPSPSSQFGSLSARGSKSSLLGSYPSPPVSYSPTGNGSEEFVNSIPEPESPLRLPPSPLSAPTPPPNPPTPPTNTNNSNATSTSTPSSAPSSFPRQSKFLPGLSRDDQSHPHHHRPLSVASSQSHISSRRGLPHGPHSQVQVIMPTPLAPGITPTCSRQSLNEPDFPGDRMSIVDRWVPTGRDSITFSNPSSQASTKPPRAPRRISSNPHNSMTTGPQINHRQYPSMPDVRYQHEPPVPRVPSMYEYEQAAGNEENRGRKLSKRIE